MRLPVFVFLLLFLTVADGRAQSVANGLPSAVVQNETKTDVLTPSDSLAPKDSLIIAEPYTITNVNADVTADTAAHARDQALMQAERSAYKQLCARFNATDDSAKLSDDNIAALVKSYEVQRERVSAVRYIGLFTIHFNPSAIQKTIAVPSLPPPPEIETSVQASVSHIMVSARADSLVMWIQLKRRLSAIPHVQKIDTLNLGHGFVNVDLSYVGLLEDLIHAASEQGLVLRQDEKGAFELFDSALGAR